MHFPFFFTTLSLLALQALGKSIPQRLSRSLANKSSTDDFTTASQVLSVMNAKSQFYTQYLQAFPNVSDVTPLVVRAQISERAQTLLGILGANDISLSASCFDFTNSLADETTANNLALVLEAAVSGAFSSNAVQLITDNSINVYFQQTTITQGRHEGAIAEFLNFNIQSAVQSPLEPSLAVAVFQDYVSSTCKGQPILTTSPLGVVTFNPQQLAPGDGSASLTLSDLSSKGTSQNVIFFTNVETRLAPLTPKAGDTTGTVFTFVGPQMENQVTFAVVSTSSDTADAIAVGAVFTIDGTV